MSPSPVRDASRSAGQPAHSFSHKSVALPAEHGSWSLVIEPILLGLLVAPSWAGLALATAAFAAFLLDRPLKLLWGDYRRRRTYERTRLARRYALLYGMVAVAGAVVAYVLAGWRPFVPLAFAAPLLALYAVYDRRPGRHWQAELAAPAAFASVAAAVALAGGLSWASAPALWGFMIARALPAVLFIRARLRVDKGKPARPWGALAAHGLAVVGILVLVWLGWLPWTAVAAVVLLLARAAWGLSAYRWRSSVKALGILEMGFGLLTVLLVAAGFWLG